MSADAMRGATEGVDGSRAEQPGSRAVSWATTAGLVVAAVFAAVMFLPAALGLQRYVITGHSMSGTYDRGSVIFSEVVPVDQLRIGDVITYEPPAGSGRDGLVTHRIVAIGRDGAGQPVLRTKGDANSSADPWQFRLEGTEQARAVTGVPYIGYAFAALGVREVRMALIGVPALLVALGLLAGLWRDAGERVVRETADAPTASPQPRV